MLSEEDEDFNISFVSLPPPTPAPRTCDFRIQIALLFAVNAVAEAARGIVIPILASFCKSLGGDEAFVGWCFAIFVMGRMVGSLLFGIWSDHRSVHEVIIFSMCLACLGNLLWIVSGGSEFDSLVTARGILCFSRLVEGLATGVISCSRALIVSLTIQGSLRDRLISWSMAAQYIGYALSPGLASFVSHWNYTPFPALVVNQVLYISHLLS